MNKPTFFDVCSGIGMGSLAAETAGFDVVGHCEIHPYCQAVLRKHWPEVPIFDDLRQLTSESLRQRGIDRVDVFAGWIPCQPASIAGQRKGAADDRWLWGEFVRLVRELRPMWLLAENPTGALSLEVSGDDGDEQFIDWVCDALEAEGYEVQAYVIGAWSVGSPQRRDRVFIVGRLADSESTGRQPHAGSVGDSATTWIRTAQNCGDVGRAGECSGEPGGLRADELGHPENVGHKRAGAARGGWYGPSDSGSHHLVDTDNAGREEQRLAFATDTRQPELRSGRQSQSGLGGTVAGSAWRLDRPLWPAGRGAEQFGYEPPRLSPRADKGKEGGSKSPNRKYRLERLMALGNMVVPQCVLPFLEAIHADLTAP